MKKSLVFLVFLIIPLALSAQSLRPTADKWENPTGPYAVTMEVYETLPDYTVYRPTDLASVRDGSLPVVIMMGPGCNQDGDSFRPFWTEVASYGYIVIAAGRPLPGSYFAPVFYLGVEDIQIAMEWVFADAQPCDALLRSKADTGHLALMGQSCGGIQCLRTAADPRVKALVFWNSGSVLMGNIDRDAPHSFGGRDIYGTTDLKKLLMDVRIPIAYFVGDTDMARQPALGDFNDLTDVPVVYAVREIPGDSHAGTFRDLNGGAYGDVAVKYLQWIFRGDKKAKAVFAGSKATLKNDPLWLELKTKNIK